MKKNGLDIEVTHDNELIIMRGIPGSGKSTESKKIAKISGVIHSTDDVIEASFDYIEYFAEMAESGDWSNHSRMHALNYKYAKKSMDDGLSPVIIDNTNIKANEPKKYVTYALKHGYADENIKFIEVGDGGCTSEELFERGTHGVPLETIEKMMQSYDSVGPLTLKKVLDSKDMFGTKSARISFVKLDDASKKKLITALGHNVPNFWKLHAHHMTIRFGKGLTKDEKVNLGKEVELRVTALGVTDKVVAVKVTGFPSDNKFPHITLGVNPEGGKPAMSNTIKKWTPLDSQTVLKGVVSESLPFTTPTTVKS